MLINLTAFRVSEELVMAISIMYEDTAAKVITPDGETKTFKLLVGVLQGNTLAPYFCHSYRLCYENRFTRKGI